MTTLNVIHKRDKYKYIKAKHAFMYVGRPTALGNPFVIGRDGTREEVIEKYREWFSAAYRPEVEEQLNQIRELMRTHRHVFLMCHCTPHACHAEVIIQHLEDK